jgi:hypothetical protein
VVPDSTWNNEAGARAETALAALSPEGLLLWRHLRRWLLGAPGDPLPSRADPRILTQTRIRATRTLPRGAAELIDVLLVLAALGADRDGRDASIHEIWRSFADATLAGEERRHPLLVHPDLQPSGRYLGRVLASMRSYLRIGLYWWERSGVPRRWLVEAKGISRARLASYLFTQVGGFKPVWSSHLPALPPNRHLTQEDFVASHLGIAVLMLHTTEVLGIASASWYYDPAIEEVTPHLAFAARIVRENGGILFEVRPDESTVEGSLGRSADRRRAAEEGRYRPRHFARIWGRAPFLAWAERQPGWQASLALAGEAR